MSRFAPAVSLLFALCVVAAPAAAETDRHVPRDFPTIGDALKAAVSGDRIVVNGGTYQECLTITGLSDLTLFGKKEPVIDLTGCPAGLTIADGARVTIEGFTLVGATLQGILVQAAASEVFIVKTSILDASLDPDLSVMLTGIAVQGAGDVTVDDVTIRGALLHAVHVTDALRPVVKRSAIRDGLGDGINVDLALNAKIEKNKIENLLGPAIILFHEGGTGPTGGAVGSTVFGNRIKNTPGAGIVIAGTGNLIENNTVDEPGGVGIEALATGGGSIYRKNTVQGPTGIGIIAAGSGDIFERATVKHPGANGLHVTGGDNIFIAPKVDEAVLNGVLVDLTASGNQFEKGLSTKAGGNGFLVLGTQNSFFQTKASKSAAFDLNDVAGPATTNEYIDCNFKKSTVPLALVSLPDF
jgi:parallel beta-helix repeat protein